MRSTSRLRCLLPLAVASLLTLGQSCVTTPPPVDNNTNNTNNNNTTSGIKGLPSENDRTAFQSQCAQNVITCTVVYPRVNSISVLAGPGQTVTQTPTGFIVQGTDHSGSEVVNLINSSSAGQGATALFYSWSQGATDSNKLTLNPGPTFSTQANPSVEMQTGLHYVRLTVHNDIFEAELLGSNGDVIATNVFLYDFLEIVIDVRD